MKTFVDGIHCITHIWKDHNKYIHMSLQSPLLRISFPIRMKYYSRICMSQIYDELWFTTFGAQYTVVRNGFAVVCPRFEAFWTIFAKWMWTIALCMPLFMMITQVVLSNKTVLGKTNTFEYVEKAKVRNTRILITCFNAATSFAL